MANHIFSSNDPQSEAKTDQTFGANLTIDLIEDATRGRINLYEGPARTKALAFLNANGYGQIGMVSNEQLRFITNNVDRLVVTNTGDIVIGGEASKSLYVAQAAATVAGSTLAISAGAAGAGTNVNGGLLLFNSGATTGNQGSRIEFSIVSSGQGSGTTVRNPVRALSIADNNDIRFWERNGVSSFVGWSAPVGTVSYSVEWPGTAPTTGQVLTATSATATAWQTPTVGANTALSNLATTSINQNLIPNADATRTLGSASFQWQSIYTTDVRKSGAGDLMLSSDNDLAANLPSSKGLKFFNSGAFVRGANGAGGAFLIQASASAAGTDLNGGEMQVKSGTATGSGVATVGLYIVRSGQATGTTVRQAELAFAIAGLNEARHYEPGTSNYVGISAPATTTSYSFSLPSTAPAAGRTLLASSATASTWTRQSEWLSEAVVGSAAQVTAGTATHSSLQAAHDAVASPGRIIMLLATITESVTWTKSNIKLEGGGRGSQLTGNLSFSAAAVGNLIRSLKVNGNVTFNVGADGNFFTDSWISNTGALTDSGAGNQTNYIQET